jgi:hypothetical protein
MILIDIDEIIPGTVYEADGRVTFAEGPATSGYGIFDEDRAMDDPVWAGECLGCERLASLVGSPSSPFCAMPRSSWTLQSRE